MVNCLAWHPESTMADKWMSPIANYLAVASDSCSIMIFDMSKLIKELEATGTEDIIENDQDCTMHKIVATLNGHSDKVVCLAWSPHFSGHLVSGSYDNIAQVKYTYAFYNTVQVVKLYDEIIVYLCLLSL